MDCPLCRQSLTDVQRGWYFDLALCRACSQAQFALPIREPGRSLNVIYTPPIRGGERGRPAEILASGSVAHARALRLTCSRRTFLSRWLDPILGRVTTGDETFDPYMTVRSRDREAAARLLRSEALRASLLECLSPGRLRVRGGQVTCVRRRDDLGHIDVNETARAVLIAMYCLERVTHA